jgi:hypothetical protein
MHHYPLEELSLAKVQAVTDILAKAKLYELGFGGPDVPKAAVKSVLTS